MRSEMREATGFTKTLIASVILHVVILSAVIFMHRPDNRHFITPVYTMVSIVEPGRAAPPTAEVKVETPIKTADKTPAPPPKKTAPERAKTRTKTIKTVISTKAIKIKTAKAHDTASVDLALKKIEKSLQKKADADLVSARIETIKKSRDNTAAKNTSAAVDEIKRRIASQSQSKGMQTAGRTGGPNASREALETQYRAYYALIRDKVQENWRYPYKDDKVMIIVYIKIAGDGRVVSSRIEESSGNGLFDESLLGAIKKASPFAPLPQGFPEAYLEAELRFCPGCAQ
ncbi:MAG: hypothetical protein A3J24_08640 [Deltaproteobacteria bacterium RIFCSPLOWO2_02_FULL_53_8]|nr:MAG: hypothetical protein A3J24_08640 [Deltaproteobacteria bacterium RIFCSPLOWO2_02_FULL_53_8]